VAHSQSIPLVILIGEETNSYAEVFSGILQANGRATLIGQTSRGNVETTHRYDFADGSRAHIAAETFIPAYAPDANWEETGIIPDIEIEQAWYEFATPEEDLALTAAIEQFE
jgi:C-terminal processing protease CtpA/Prc